MKRIFVISVFTMLIGLMGVLGVLSACAFFYPLELYNTVQRLRGETNQSIVTNIKDTTLPTILISTPTPGTKVGGIYLLEGVVSDTDSGIDKVYYCTDNGSYAETMVNNNIFQVSISLSNYGIHTNYVYAIDKAGNTSSTQSVNIERADISAIVISSPINGLITNSILGFPVYIVASADAPAILTNIVLEVYGNDNLLKYTISEHVNDAMVGTTLQAQGFTTGSNMIVAYALADNGKIAIVTNNYIIDINAPIVSPNPSNDFGTNEAFTATLSVNENYGYWSTNGSPFVEFTTTGASVDINGYVELQYYGADIAWNTSSTQNVIYFTRNIYVSTSGNDTNNGGTIDKAVLTIQKAIEIAKSYVCDRVLVGTGVYTQGAGLSNTVLANDYASVNITDANNINLIGGWNSDFTAQTGYSELGGSGASVSKHIIWIENTTNLTIDGFVIRDGDADITSGCHRNGGGVYITNTSHTLITNCIISNNAAYYLGGGVYLTGSHSNTINATITSNRTIPGYGGGVGIIAGSSNTISGTVSGNTATIGAGIRIYSGSYNVISGIISNNTAEDGGGVFIDGSYNTISGNIINNSTVPDTMSKGGGVFNLGTFTTIGGTVSGNTSDYGGGVCNEGTFTTISGTISGNTANSGGGVYNGGPGSAYWTGTWGTGANTNQPNNWAGNAPLP